MNIIVKTPLVADKIKNLLDGGSFDGVSFSFLDKKGADMRFAVTGGEGRDAVDIAKAAIKATSYGKGIYFSVVKE